MWTIVPVVVAGLLAAGDFGDKFWGSASDSRVTSFQVSQLTDAVKVLAGKFDVLPKQSAIDALVIRLDREASDQQRHWDQISQTFGQSDIRFNADELTTKGIDGRVTALDGRMAAMENRLPAQPFRNPQPGRVQ